jgi:hypothetical protein
LGDRCCTPWFRAEETYRSIGAVTKPAEAKCPKQDGKHTACEAVFAAFSGATQSCARRRYFALTPRARE